MGCTAVEIIAEPGRHDIPGREGMTMYDYKDAVKAMMDVGHGLWVLMVFAVSLILLVISTVAGYIA